MKVFYPAILEKGAESYGVFFPDLDGCVAAADDANAALLDAEQVLAIYLEHMVAGGEKLPKPSDISEIQVDDDINVVARVFVGAEITDKKIRVNVNLPESLVAAIDKVAANRSSFIVDAVRAAL